jgi:hypothetical protein
LLALSKLAADMTTTFTPEQLREIQQLIDEAVGSGSGFPNPITAGNILLLTKLILQGPGTALLVYAGTPALGNLKAALSTAVGVDQFGNHYGVGLTFPSTDGSNNYASISSSMSGALLHLDLVADIISIIANQFTEIIGDLTVGGATNLQGNLVITAGSTMKFSAGVNGKYYAEIVNPPAQVLVSGTNTVLINLTALNLNSDYGSAWNLATGTWTCPVDGYYDISVCVRYTGWVAGSRSNLAILVNGALIDLGQDQLSTGGSISTSGTRELFVGDTVQVRALQVTGANQTLVAASSFIAIARRL